MPRYEAPSPQRRMNSGQQYRRGVPQSIDARTAQLLQSPPLQSLFIIAPTPTFLDTTDPRWCAVFPEPTPCVWEGDYAILTGPIITAEDDDHHQYYRGVPLEICSKTTRVLTQDAYRSHFTIYNRASTGVTGHRGDLQPDRRLLLRRHPAMRKGSIRWV